MNSRAAIAVFLGYAVVIAYLSLTPTGAINVGSHDKSAHFLSYTVFAILGVRIGLSRKGFIALCIGIVFYSALMEFGQSFVPNRQMSALDLVANAMGVLVGYAACVWYRRAAALKGR